MRNVHIEYSSTDKVFSKVVCIWIWCEYSIWTMLLLQLPFHFDGYKFLNHYIHLMVTILNPIQSIYIKAKDINLYFPDTKSSYSLMILIWNIWNMRVVSTIRPIFIWFFSLFHTGMYFSKIYTRFALFVECMYWKSFLWQFDFYSCISQSSKKSMTLGYSTVFLSSFLFSLPSFISTIYAKWVYL